MRSWLHGSSTGVAAADLGNGRNDVVPLVGRQIGEQRQTDQAAPLGRGHRTILRSPAKLVAIVVVQVQRAPMDRAADPLLFQLGDEGVAIDCQTIQAQPDREQMPGMNPPLGERRQFDGHMGQFFTVSQGDFLPGFA